MDDILKTIIKHANRKGWSEVEWANRAGVSRQYMRRVLAGENQPTVEWLQRLIRPLGLKIVVKRK